MKFLVQMKDPDTLFDAVTEALKDDPLPGLTDDEADRVREMRHSQVQKFAARWFEYGEYLTVQLDTEAETCVVMESGKS